MTVNKLVKELEKIEEVLRVGINSLDVKKDYEEAKRLLVGIKLAVNTLIEKSKEK